MTVDSAGWLRPLGDRFVEDEEAGFDCSGNQYGLAVDLTGDDHPEMMCVSTVRVFARVWDVSSRPFRDVSSVMPEVHDVIDVVAGDFDGNLRTDLLLLSGALRPSDMVSFDRPEEVAPPRRRPPTAAVVVAAASSRRLPMAPICSRRSGCCGASATTICSLMLRGGCS
jgi:hypothetical protein